MDTQGGNQSPNNIRSVDPIGALPPFPERPEETGLDDMTEPLDASMESEYETEEPETESTEPEPVSEPAAEDSFPWFLVFWSSVALLCVDLLGILMLSAQIRDLSRPRRIRTTLIVPEKETEIEIETPLSVGTVHGKGKRQYQQDSLGHGIVLDGQGLLAVVADGMGGLKNGERVSQKIVLRTLELGESIPVGQENGALNRILKQVNEDVNRMLGPDGLYKSGSTIVAVLVSDGAFQWISVGDSRIYLYRAGYVNQLNRDHDLLQEWMPEILEGKRTMEDALKDPAGRKLTSFIGMGQLKYVDSSIRSIEIMPGDRIILMSDGVYGVLPDSLLAETLRRYPDVRQAAAAIERQIQSRQNPHQDNYTAMILGF